MLVSEIREKYLKFFESKGHKIIDPAPLVLENDPTTLFTSSGMQPLVPYLMGMPHESGSKRLVDSQPSIRVQDIEEVGDNRHTTFFEMLGNWSLGDYFKKEQLPWIWEFLTSKKGGLGLPKERLYVTLFEGDKDVPRDIESYDVWRSLGVWENHIFEYGVSKNWWSRSGTPEHMPEGEIGGPDSEIFFEFESVKHDPKFGEKCHPNCDCGRFLEIGNSVFIQYKKLKNGKLEELPQKNVDFGGGLERLAAATNKDPDVFKIDVYEKFITTIEEITGKSYSSHEREMRIVADHLRASIALISDGVIPSNKLQGYVLRRLIRRLALKMKSLKKEIINADFEKLTDNKIFLEEIDKFNKTLETGLKEAEKIKEIDGKIAFDLYQTYGFPLELSIEIFQEKGQQINVDEFKKAFLEHQNKSRTASAGVFKGGLADHSLEVTRLHTATHLLHAALRKVLGTSVQQKGSNITSERLRFDFTHPNKLTNEEIKQIEELINEQIDLDLPVSIEMMTLEQADKAGALHFFDKKYEDSVKVYTIGPTSHEASLGAQPFSREVCGGPHVTHLAELGGHVTIIKEEAVSSGVRRIYASLTS